MPQRRCPFCHEMVSGHTYDAHIERHTTRRADGQMEDHVTLPPEQRYSGSLEDAPKVYWHERCEQCTRMPDDIIRSYLKNPFLYNNTTFCAGCGNYFHTREFQWTETGETLYDYNEGLKAEYRRRHPSLIQRLINAISSLLSGSKAGKKPAKQRKRRSNDNVEDMDEYLEPREDKAPKLRKRPKRPE